VIRMMLTLAVVALFATTVWGGAALRPHPRLFVSGSEDFAPFYDFTYSEGPNGWQTLSVAGEGRNPAQADLDRLAEEVGL